MPLTRQTIARQQSAQQSICFSLATGGDYSLWLPSLVLLVNPNTLETQFSKVVTEETTLGAYVEYHWGDQLSRVSGSGVTLGFFSFDKNEIFRQASTQQAGASFDRNAFGSRFPPEKPKATVTFGTAPAIDVSEEGIKKVLVDGIPRKDTPAYKNFEDLLFLYKYNGAEQRKDDGQVESYAPILMTFGADSYLGNFESFNWRETDARPHQFEYSFEFEVVQASFRLNV